jgi:hypothetical protein
MIVGNIYTVTEVGFLDIKVNEAQSWWCVQLFELVKEEPVQKTRFFDKEGNEYVAAGYSAVGEDTYFVGGYNGEVFHSRETGQTTERCLIVEPLKRKINDTFSFQLWVCKNEGTIVRHTETGEVSSFVKSDFARPLSDFEDCEIMVGIKENQMVWKPLTEMEI